MIVLKSRDEVESLRRSNRVVAEVLIELSEAIAPGITTGDLEAIAVSGIKKRGAKAAFPTVPGYHHALCVSVNEQVVHGIPGARRLEDGDIVSIDCGVILDGFFGDHAWTFPVGKVSPEAKKLLDAGEKSLLRGIEQAKDGNRLHDISSVIENVASENGFSVVRDYVGHGIGRSLHEDPQVPNFGEPGTGLKLKRGLVIALEPMLNVGTHEVEVLRDGWTVVTKDRKLSAHFEHVVAIMENGPEILSVI
ncbi:MAG TPA: type I methionyl aminopeptidase [bacterium]|nr:type I methionyl aminopeptidase [Myxococcales bacterium]OQA58612.1 MAG: Methionine aminopeptidase 1 [bacterium ADurb.Bin270]HPW45358.1 type I methionyl aminopeptidase [bacterium]HQC51106.1 type I methionyl aminopeptidase [bacterium]HQG13155.1 type I methionyl aminopeptidase [bacterium]